MSRARELARLGNENVISVDSNNQIGIGSQTPDRKLDVGTGELVVGAAITLGGNSGIISATSFSGNLTGSVTSSGAVTISDSTASTSTSTGALKVTGGVGIAKSLFVGEGVSVAGTITYNDVTNIDSVGIVTARGGVKVGPLAGVAATIYLTGDAHFIGVVTAGSISGGSSVSATTYYGSGANLTGIEGGVAGVNTTGFSTFTTVSVGGISTFVGLVTTGDMVSSGIITAKAFVPSQGQLSHRNLIINGAMTIQQRSGGSVSDSGYQTVDRFKLLYGGQDEALTQKPTSLSSSDTGPFGEGFRQAYLIRNGNQTSGAGAADYAEIMYCFEARDIATSGWLYTSASSYITLSFWVKSTVAQTYYGYLHSIDGTEQLYAFSFALSANTWSKVTKTIPGNANVAFDFDINEGLRIGIVPFYGTDYTTSGHTLNQWAAKSSSNMLPDNTSTWWTTNDAEFELTGVQLEVGAVATPFEHRSYADELFRCQRYYVRKGSPNTSIGDGGGYFTAYTQGSSNKFVGTYWFPQQLRETPAAVEWSGTVAQYGGTCDNDGEMVATAIGNSHVCSTSGRIHLTVSSVSGGKGGLIMSKSTSGYFAWSAEI
jgi:hypothetical protein